MRGYRFMRIIVMFDLPTETVSDRREYRKFRKNLLDFGFIMLQESIYHKLLLNASLVNSMELKLEAIKPQNGLFHILTITEKQYSKMTTLVGEDESDILSTDERLIIL